MKSVLILQGTLAEYRKAVFNRLADYYNVVILHSGPSATSGESRYDEIIVSSKQLGPFRLQDYSAIQNTQQKFDIVIAMFDLRWPAYLVSLLRRKRPRYILWGHRYSGNRLANATRDWLMKKADGLLMYGDKEIAQMVKRGIDPRRIVLAPNTIHIPNHQDYSTSPKRSLLFVGRLQQRKRIDLIIELFAQLQGQICNDIVLDIVGEGSLEGFLKKQARDLNIADKVTFHGNIDDPEQLSRLFSTAYAYVSPGPVGLGVLHSFAYGVPVLTLREGRHGPEFHNLIHGHNAIICENVEGLDKAMARVCTDSYFAKELGRNAYHYYKEKRTLELMVAGFRKVIEGDLLPEDLISEIVPIKRLDEHIST